MKQTTTVADVYENMAVKEIPSKLNCLKIDEQKEEKIFTQLIGSRFELPSSCHLHDIVDLICINER